MPMMAHVAAMTEDVTFIFVNQGEGANAIGSYMASEGIEGLQERQGVR